MKQNKRIIGLTGTIASGKSTAAAYLSEQYGIPCIDADRVGHEVLKSAEVQAELVQAFGEAILTDGVTDRKKLSAFVYAEPSRLETLNAITHPVIIDRIRRMTEDFLAGSDPAPFLIVEAYGLLETALQDLVQEIWGVGCERRLRLNRVMARQHLTETEARARILRQWPDERYREACDVWLDGSGDTAFLKAQCDILMKRFIQTDDV